MTNAARTGGFMFHRKGSDPNARRLTNSNVERSSVTSNYVIA